MKELAAKLTGKEWKLLVNGNWIDSSNGSTIKVNSPADGSTVGIVSAATAVEVDLAVTTAHQAFKEWQVLPGNKRESIIRKATAHVRTKADEIAMLMTLEQGKPFNQSRGEVLSSCDTIDYYAAEAVRLEGYTNPTENSAFRSWVIYQPVGVCALITPWNYPVSLLSWKLGPALATGCTAVVKPSSVTPLSPLAFCAALLEGGLPAGTINVINGNGKDIGDILLKHPLVEKVAMTGSSETGKLLMKNFGPSLKKISLELGGHCPAIVCEDSDLDNAVEVIAYKAFRNCGQSCSSINRVYVQESILEDFITRMKSNAENLRLGNGIDEPDIDLGPMCTMNGIHTSEDHIRDAVAKGANLVVGGAAPDGNQFNNGSYFLPTILTNVNDQMKVMNEETFGPVLPVDTFKTIEEGISKANRSKYGLVSYLFTRDLGTTMKVSEALEAGTVAVNTSAVNTNYAPYSGWKESGYGAELGRRAVFEYLKVKHVKVKLT